MSKVVKRPLSDKWKISHVWYAMINRCYKPEDLQYKNYGGRGIKVCEEWKKDRMAFVNWALISGWAKGLQIDRIDNNGNYEPDNCRFVTDSENKKNTRFSGQYYHTGIDSSGDTKTKEILKSIEGIPDYFLTKKELFLRQKYANA